MKARDRVYLAAVTGLAMAWDGEPVTDEDADKVVLGARCVADAHDRVEDAAKRAQSEADKLAREALARRIETVRYWTWTDNMSDAPVIVVGEVVAVRMAHVDARLDTGHMSGEHTSVEFGSFDGGDGDVQPATRATVRAAALAGESTWTPAMRALVVGALAGEGAADAAELPEGVARLARIYRELVVRESAVYPDAAAFLAAFKLVAGAGSIVRFDARLRIGPTTTCVVDGNGRVLLAPGPTRHLLDLALDEVTGDVSVRHLRTALRTLVQSSTNDGAIRTAMFAVATALRLDAEVV